MRTSAEPVSKMAVTDCDGEIDGVSIVVHLRQESLDRAWLPPRRALGSTQADSGLRFNAACQIRDDLFGIGLNIKDSGCLRLEHDNEMYKPKAV